MRVFVQITLLVTVFPTLAQASSMRDEVDRRYLMRIEELLRSHRSELDGDARRVLEQFSESVVARLADDFAAEGFSLLEVYRLSRDMERHDDSRNPLEKLGVDYTKIPEQLAISALQSRNADYFERLGVVGAISVELPDSVSIGDALIEILEEKYDYQRVIEYCDARVDQGHNYFKVMRARMYIRAQLEANHMATEAEYGHMAEDRVELLYEYYSPRLLEQKLSIAGINQIRQVLPSAPAEFARSCSDIILAAYAVSWLDDSDVLPLLALSKERIVSGYGEVSGAGLLQYVEAIEEIIRSLSPRSGRLVDARENMGDGKELHTIARLEGVLLDEPVRIPSQFLRTETQASSERGDSVDLAKLSEGDTGVHSETAVAEGSKSASEFGSEHARRDKVVPVVLAVLLMIAVLLAVGLYVRSTKRRWDREEV